MKIGSKSLHFDPFLYHIPINQVRETAIFPIDEIVCGGYSEYTEKGWIFRTPGASAKNPGVFGNAQTRVTQGKTAVWSFLNKCNIA